MSAHQLLKQYFGHDEFRPGQLSVIESLLGGCSALAIFPTGGGKSLCYQLPALSFGGITLVVSPLIALMKDQVESLQRLGISAARLDSTIEFGEVNDIYKQMREGSIRLLYVAPERLSNEGFLRRLRDCKIALLAIDEAHCISEWGHNFRPDYLKLAELSETLQVERVLALTATATPRVAVDIRERFNIDPADHFQTSFYRSNLIFMVDPCPAEEKKARLVEKIRSRPDGPSVIYVTLQRTAEEVAGYLARAGLDARAYHAGMRADHRSDLQDDFMAGKQMIIVATIAFGMGIDKADIRYVYHYNLPKSLENYVQESGRAGRDGDPATCEILASRNDVVVLENFVFGDTPSPSAIRSLVEHVILQGEQFSISKYELSGSKDIRPMVISTALTYLELDQVITSEGPFYAGYQFQLLAPIERILSGHSPSHQSLIEQIIAASSKRRIWYTCQIAETALALDVSEAVIRQTIDDLERSGDLKTKVSGLRHAYRLNPDVDNSVSQLTKRLVELFETRERGEIERIRLVVEHCESTQCLAGRILSYFGDDYMACGQCSVCTGVNTGQALPSPPVLDIKPDQAELIIDLNDEKHRALRQPRQLARFLCGLSSPATSRARLQKHDAYALLEEVQFQDVLAYCESLV